MTDSPSQDTVVDELVEIHQERVDELCRLHRFRQRQGHIKYGVTLDRKDLTPAQWCRHLMEEQMDGALYALRLTRELIEMEWSPGDTLPDGKHDGSLFELYYENASGFPNILVGPYRHDLRDRDPWDGLKTPRFWRLFKSPMDEEKKPYGPKKSESPA